MRNLFRFKLLPPRTEARKAFLTQVNFARYHGQPQGFYESFFQRANHPTRPLAFWIRYTLFSPQGQPERALGELWAIFFNGETNQHLVYKQEFPFGECLFSPAELILRIGNAQLDVCQLHGSIQSPAGSFSWELSFSGTADPLLLLPFALYKTKFPAAKSLVGLPMARFNGKLSFNGETVEIVDWTGSQNHNWGTRHTDRYAWGQVAGFDNYPESFLEVASARLRLGPFWTPPITPIVLRHQGREYTFNALFSSIRANSSSRAHSGVEDFTWHFKSQSPQAEIEGSLAAPRQAFVGLLYANPPGGIKHCLNTKLAACTVRFRDKTRGTAVTLETGQRAAFEILTDDQAHGIPISA